VRNLRRASQLLFLLLFLYLFLQTRQTGQDELGYPVRIFLDFDPLILLTTLLTTHSPARAFWLAGITILLTLLGGRIYCGWFCPLGTLHSLVSRLGRRNKENTWQHLHSLKYFILIILVSSALASMQLTGLLDPIALLIRSLSVSLYPLFNYGGKALFDTLYDWNLPLITDASENLAAALRGNLFAFQPPYFRQGAFTGIFFIVILALNLLEKRFWCRYLCPLGALLGLFSRYAFFRRTVNDACTECRACEPECHGNTSPASRPGWLQSECYWCGNCKDICPGRSVSFGFSGNKTGEAVSLGRRRVVVAALSGVAVVPLLRAMPYKKIPTLEARLIRPPGALAEEEFLERCVKCGECMKVCTTNGLQPTLLEAGFEGIWSPLLVPRLGYCEFHCTLCGQVCPTGAIRPLNQEEKMRTRIGLAFIDRNRCLPWSLGLPCIVCEEVCPTPKKAIWLEERQVTGRDATTAVVQQPVVDPALCIGCGICEASCPIRDQPAIYVTCIGESRAEGNQLLL